MIVDFCLRVLLIAGTLMVTSFAILVGYVVFDLIRNGK